MSTIYVTEEAAAAWPGLLAARKTVCDYIDEHTPFVHSVTVHYLVVNDDYHLFEITAYHKHAGTEAYKTMYLDADLVATGFADDAGMMTHELDIANDVLMRVRAKPEGPSR